jgi:hypothetical protein
MRTPRGRACGFVFVPLDVLQVGRRPEPGFTRPQPFSDEDDEDEDEEAEDEGAEEDEEVRYLELLCAGSGCRGGPESPRLCTPPGALAPPHPCPRSCLHTPAYRRTPAAPPLPSHPRGAPAGGLRTFVRALHPKSCL